MDREAIINFFTACFNAGRLKDMAIPVSYYGNLFLMRDFEMCWYGGQLVLHVWQDEFRHERWEECNGEAVPLFEYDTDYLEKMYRSFLDKYSPDKNLF